jgi:hypothetical protein
MIELQKTRFHTFAVRGSAFPRRVRQGEAMKFQDCLLAYGRQAARHLPFASFVGAVLLGMFSLGIGVGFYQWWPFDMLQDAKTVATALFDELGSNRIPNHIYVGESRWPVSRIAEQRVVEVAPRSSEDFLMVAGASGLFRDLCPNADGCFAVEFARDGHVVKAYPFRPEQLAAHMIVQEPYEEVGFDPLKNILPVGAWPLADGDMIVSLDFLNAFPYGGGVARVHANGNVVWYRLDDSNHWGTVLRDGTILTTSIALSRGKDRIAVAPGNVETLNCRNIAYHDIVRVIAPDGRHIRSYSVFDALAQSPYRAHLLYTLAPCDPIHLNLVRPLGDELSKKIPGTRPDDLLISMRAISAFAVLDWRTGKMTHFFKGSFVFQHAVQSYPGGKIIMFDNLGADQKAGPSRVLIYDPATGREQTVFPGPDTPPGTVTYSPEGGYIDLSADGTRALVTVDGAGMAYEIAIPGGAILARLTNLQNVGVNHQTLSADAKASIFRMTEVRYVMPDH